MKAVVATKLSQGDRSTDFNWTIEGELVTVVGSECASEGCGCWRGFPGLASHKATTTAIVVDLPLLTPRLLRQAVVDSLDSQGWLGLLPDSAGKQMVDAAYESILDVARHFPLGAILERDRDIITMRSIAETTPRAA